MIWGVVFWVGLGLVSSLWLWWLMNMGNRPEEFTLGDLVSGAGLTLLGGIFGPIAFMMAISETWDRFNLANITLWKRKSIDLKKEAQKQGYELKPLKGMDD